MDHPVADQRPTGVPLWAEPGEVRGWASGTPPTARGVRSPPWALAAGTHEADAGPPAGHHGAHVGGAALGRHHGDVELLQHSGRRLVRAQLAPAHGQAPHAVAHALVLPGQPGHAHVGVDGGRPVELQWAGQSTSGSRGVVGTDPLLSQTRFPLTRSHHGSGHPRYETLPPKASVSPAVKWEQPQWLRASLDVS